ncbi:MAG: cysteine desulfurase [Lentilactobacillus diolivorans]|uniref:cysteine desulfurase n=2 Tax=Lentilactobacillus diolivorans TaxID=179838 RepID=A0A0R1SIQ2_9LACO|nr:cysteine desulfurase [Lentilactobacillus diolivorans]KRL69071.1 cysteine desulfurase [Lentilactobacillus diolivorans DSM 14421]MDH5104619.1 cysteine desulfurase [Lentilactobacillus diolivorans]GEP22483.1 cysteine desulfurase [Lentilactobacillus diolivorans]
MAEGFNQFRADFPILQQTVNGEPLTYLDNAATAQKPNQVISALTDYYRSDNANVHRGVHTLAERATLKYEAARKKVQTFINADESAEVIFTKGATDGLNLVASTYGEENVHEGDEIVISITEHHSNLIPWQQLALRKKATLKYIGLTPNGEIDLDDAARQITDQTKIVAITHASNVMGTITPLKKIGELAHQHGAILVGDGAQAVPHIKVDVQDLDADFYVFSGHKMMAPTGIGVLYGKRQLLEEMPPYQYGGEMIDFVNLFDSTWTQLPWKFEAGTQNIAGAIGLGIAIDYLNTIGMAQVTVHEQQLVDYVLPKLVAIDGVTVFGPHDPSRHTGVIAFNIQGIHPHDVATAFDMDGVAVRAGHHCAQPLMNTLGQVAMVRASFYLYNTQTDADKLLSAIKDTKEFFNYGAVKA